MSVGLVTPGRFQVGSFQVNAANANSGNLRTAAVTATGRAIPVCETVTLILSTTALTADANARLFVYLEHSWDGGTTWAVAEAFLVVSTSTDVQNITCHPTGTGQNEAAVRTSITTGTAATIAQNVVLAPDQRIAWIISGDAGVGPTATFTVNAITQPIRGT